MNSSFLAFSPLSSTYNTHKFSFPVECEKEREREKRDFFIVLSYNIEIMKKYEQQEEKSLREASSIETVMSEERHNLIESKRGGKRKHSNTKVITVNRSNSERSRQHESSSRLITSRRPDISLM